MNDELGNRSRMSTTVFWKVKAKIREGLVFFMLILHFYSVASSVFCNVMIQRII